MASNQPCTCGGELSALCSKSGTANLTSSGARIYAICAACGKKWSIWFDVNGVEVKRRPTQIRTRKAAPRDNAMNRPTLCWKCANARATGCSWHRRGVPVKGWDAMPSEKYGQTAYTVVNCPEFAEERRKA